MKCIGPKAKDADLRAFIWEEVRRVHQEVIYPEVEYVKAHRSKKEQPMSLFQKSVTEGNAEVDELAKAGARLDG